MKALWILGIILASVSTKSITDDCINGFWPVTTIRPSYAHKVLVFKGDTYYIKLDNISHFGDKTCSSQSKRGRALSLSNNVFEVIGASTTQEVHVFINVTGIATGAAASATLLDNVKSLTRSAIGSISENRVTASFTHYDPTAQTSILITAFPEPGGISATNIESAFGSVGTSPFTIPDVTGTTVIVDKEITTSRGTRCPTGTVVPTEEQCAEQAVSLNVNFSLLHSYNFTGCAFYQRNNIFGHANIPSVVYSPIPFPGVDRPDSISSPGWKGYQQLGCSSFVEKCYCVHKSYTPPRPPPAPPLPREPPVRPP